MRAARRKKPPEVELPFRRERILAVGVLAFLAPIPLAFTPALEPAPLLLYLALLGGLLLAVHGRRVISLSNLVLNAIGVLYVFAIYTAIRYGLRSLLKTALYLLLFTTVVKLASVKKERDFSVALILTGFLFLASIANAFHVTIVPYLVGYLFVAWPVLVRWSVWRDLAGAPDEWQRDADVRALPGWRATGVSLAATLAIAVPLFILLPRLKSPYVRGFEEARELTTGFTEQIDPDAYGVLKTSDRVLIRVTSDKAIPPALRFRAITYSTYEGRTWTKPKSKRVDQAGHANTPIRLLRRDSIDPERQITLNMDLTPLQSRFVPYPDGSAAVTLDEGAVRNRAWGYHLDTLRNLRLSFQPDRVLRYSGILGGRPVLDLNEPSSEDPSREPLGSERIKDWAEKVTAGSTAPHEKARQVEGELQSSRFSYALEIAKSGASPVEEFLFDRRTGACEIFATSMAMSLREIGIPTRVVSGFAGGEVGLFGRFVSVRGRDAHVWVEAWTGSERGWVTYDPTPFLGRPGLTRATWRQGIKQAAEAVEFFYDRFILSFGSGDQVGLVRWLRDAAGTVTTALRLAKEGAGELLHGLQGRALGFALIGALAAAALYAASRLVRGKPVFSFRSSSRAAAALAYRRLQKALARKGAALGEASAPSETLAAAAPFGPEVLGPSGEIVKVYVAESFGGAAVDEAEARRLAELVGQVKEALKARPRKAAPVPV